MNKYITHHPHRHTALYTTYESTNTSTAYIHTAIIFLLAFALPMMIKSI